MLLVSVYLSHHNPKLKKEIFFLSYSNVSITFRAHDVVLEPVIESKKSEVNVAELENGWAWVGPNLLPVYLFSAWTSETIRMQPRTGHKLLRHNLFLILSPGLITNYKLCTCLKFYWWLNILFFLNNIDGTTLKYGRHISTTITLLCTTIFTCVTRNRNISFRSHGSLSAVTHAPFHASMLRPVSQAGPMHESAGVGEVS